MQERLTRALGKSLRSGWRWWHSGSARRAAFQEIWIPNAGFGQRGSSAPTASSS